MLPTPFPFQTWMTRFPNRLSLAFKKHPKNGLRAASQLFPSSISPSSIQSIFGAFVVPHAITCLEQHHVGSLFRASQREILRGFLIPRHILRGHQDIFRSARAYLLLVFEPLFALGVALPVEMRHTIDRLLHAFLVRRAKNRRLLTQIPFALFNQSYRNYTFPAERGITRLLSLGAIGMWRRRAGRGK